MISEFRVVDIRLDLISGASVNGSGYLIDGQTILTAAHVLSSLADDRVATVFVRTVFGSHPDQSLDPDRLSFARVGDPDPDRDGRASVDAITQDLAVVHSQDLPFSFESLPRTEYDASYPATRFVLDGFSARPSFGVNSGMLSPETAALWRFDDSLAATPGDSGSVVFAVSNEGLHANGVTSTTRYAVALDSTAWAWVHAANVTEAARELVQREDHTSGFAYSFRTTVGDDVLIRHTESATYVGGLGYDRAIIDGDIDRLSVDSLTGDFQVTFTSGDEMQLMGFEQVLTPEGRFYSTNDEVYSNLYRVITVLAGTRVADDWAPQARYWFSDSVTEVDLVDSVLTLLKYNPQHAPADIGFIASVADHIDLASRPKEDAEKMIDWAESQSYLTVTLGAMAVVDQFLGSEFG